MLVLIERMVKITEEDETTVECERKLLYRDYTRNFVKLYRTTYIHLVGISLSADFPFPLAMFRPRSRSLLLHGY